MNLKELQAMIKEELDAYMNEETVSEETVSEENVSEETTDEAMAVNVDADDVDADGDMRGDDSEDLLRKIFDMLKDKFEMEDMDDEEDDMDEDNMMESEETVSEEADLEEAASTGFGDAGAKNTSGKDAGYTPAKTTRGDGKLHENKEEETSALQERFQKLANIIK